MTAALEGGEWSAARPDRTLPPGKSLYPLYRRLGGPQGRSGRTENLFHTGIRFRTVQPVVSRYTDWATGPTDDDYIFVKYCFFWNCTWVYSHVCWWNTPLCGDTKVSWKMWIFRPYFLKSFSQPTYVLAWEWKYINCRSQHKHCPFSDKTLQHVSAQIQLSSGKTI